ncbi:hypothetical protein [Roseibium suaedae]|uniref:ATP-binding protein n=1 Tax=Roseibium suaedae TaxID=735517 RepID=A0A1M7L5R2_9HYPH|nr:hypothetical protein [Roseibium suaedae]SHM73222.1 hypothetical protein SAMN05444272_3080 [Roseibium suaedae]
MTRKMFRSINIADDVWHSERVSHYIPTSRSAPVVSAVIRPGATMVVSSYGSGKSLAASVGAICVRNAPDDGPFLKDMAVRMAGISNDGAELIGSRAKSGARGAMVLLSGYVRDLPAEICASLGLGNLKTMQKTLNAVSKLEGVDHVAIVWDEFGRHLEGLVMDGRSRDLDNVQRLAEWSVRTDAPTASLTLLLHQNLLAYAESLNQTARSEWRKIEGRFEQIRFVEDSRELYGLLAESIAGRTDALPDKRMIGSIAEGAVESGWFDGMTSADATETMLSRAWPLSAGALQVLPRLVSRVGQNERSLFSFIEGVSLEDPIGLNEVYLAFSEAIRSDVGVGGLHRKWVEAESARGKCATDLELEIVSATFLLQIGLSGERRHLTRAALELAVRSKGYSRKDVHAAVSDLISRKLILHRKLNDDVSVWHGADIDVASRVSDERMKIMTGFDLPGFLSEQHPAPFVKPIRHNLEKGTSRYLSGFYVMPENLADFLEFGAPEAPWGAVAYVMCGSADDVRVAREAAESDTREDTVIVIPHDPVQVLEASLEIASLLSLKSDNAFLSEDPLVGTEIDELLGVARRHLELAMHRLTSQRPSAATWYSGGRVLNVNWDRPASASASDMMDRLFPLTPKIVNDQMVRQRISRQMTTNRIRLITKIMEHADKSALGYASDDGSAEASIYRTLLQHTGVHVSDPDGTGRFAETGELQCPGLAEAWMKIRDFFVEPGRKSLTDISDALAAAPIGMAEGVIPVYVMAGYKAFGSCVSIYSDGDYVPDILGFESVRMFETPDKHTFVIHDKKEETLSYLAEISFAFAQKRPGKYQEHVRFADDCLKEWMTTVADGARRSRRLTDDARGLLRLIQEASDPADLFLVKIPETFGKRTKKGLPGIVSKIETCRTVIDGLIDGYLRDAVEIIQATLSVGNAEDTMEGIRRWVSCMDVDMMIRRPDLRQTDKAILRTANESLQGNRHTPETLARVFTSVLLQRGIERWQDNTAEQLRKELRECRLRIEAAALDGSTPSRKMEPIIRSQIEHLQQMLETIKSEEEGARAK